MKIRLALLCMMLLCPLELLAAEEFDPTALVKEAIEYWRDKSSYVESSMLVHRPDWKREMAFQAWTLGIDRSLVRFVKPKKDAGSASLTLEDDIWTFAPKINRVIKIPPSMKAQSWMGSDFSYRDLAKADDVIRFYTHRLVGEEAVDGKKVYVVESIPLENAPVVWGKEVLRVREDKVLLQHDFYDQDMKHLKSLKTKKIEEIGGKLYPTVMRMENLEEKDEWTEVVTEKAEFDVSIPKSTFTLSNLRNPRRGK